MRRHALKFIFWFGLFTAGTLVAQQFWPHLKLLPMAAEFVPSFIRPAPAASIPVLTAQPVFEGHEKALGNFYRKLAGLRSGKTDRVRVMHFGDSVIWYERVARDIRAGLIRDFGDGGRGQLYLHQDWGVTLADLSILNKIGFSFHSVPYNHFNHFEPKWVADAGFSSWTYRAESQFSQGLIELGSGTAAVNSLALVLRPTGKGEIHQKVQITNLEKNPPESKEYDLALQPGTCSVHELPFGATRKFALSFGDKALPREASVYIDAALVETPRGISYSTFVHKGKHMAWMTAVTPSAFDCGYRATHPDLLVFQYGINEGASIDWKAFGFSHELYRKQMREFFGRIRQALPETDILIIGPYERLKKNGNDWLTYKAHDDVRLMQRDMAREMGFAFFDSYTFLGGAGHMRRMIREGTATGDFAHLNDKGSQILGNEVYRQLYAGFEGKAAIGETATPGEKKAETSAPTPILFNSLTFAYFFMIVAGVAAFLSRFPAARLIFLTLASWYFYASWRYWALGLMLFSVCMDYTAALGIERNRNTRPHRATVWLITSLVANLGILFFFKYFDFFAQLLNPALAKGGLFQIPVLHLVLPVGISFYTFQSLSYTIDVYRNHLPAERSFWRFSFFVAFFPQLVAGPIVRATDFLPRLMREIRHFFPDKDDFSSAVWLFTKGLFKKTLADWISVNVADRVFADPGMFTATETLVGIYAFGIQIYLDFSSYTDMAIGAARLMGFHLTINFNRPYISASITEFWRRWHISLSTWLRDYLYISLGGNRKRLYLNLFLTMLLGGLWHGAGINFVLWGVFHGVILMLERATGYAEYLRRLAENNRGKLVRALAVLFTFHLVMLSWILFRSHDFAAFRGVIESLRSLTFTAPNVDGKILLAIGLPYLWQLVPEKLRYLPEFSFVRVWPVLQAAGVYVASIATYRIFTAEMKNFIYFQF